METNADLVSQFFRRNALACIDRIRESFAVAWIQSGKDQEYFFLFFQSGMPFYRLTFSMCIFSYKLDTFPFVPYHGTKSQII